MVNDRVAGAGYFASAKPPIGKEEKTENPGTEERKIDRTRQSEKGGKKKEGKGERSPRCCNEQSTIEAT